MQVGRCGLVNDWIVMVLLKEVLVKFVDIGKNIGGEGDFLV